MKKLLATAMITCSIALAAFGQFGVERVGAMCADGTQSSATGSGACSHHGGVVCWIYSDGSCR